MFSKFNNKLTGGSCNLTALKSTRTLISQRAYLGKLLTMLWIRSLPVIRFPTDICAERFSTNSRLLAKNKTVTCTVINNEHTFQHFSSFQCYNCDLCKYSNVNKFYPRVIIRKTLMYTRTRSVLKRVTISNKIKPFLTRQIIVATNSYFVRFQ